MYGKEMSSANFINLFFQQFKKTPYLYTTLYK